MIERPTLDPTRPIKQCQCLRQQRATVVVQLQPLADPIKELQLEQPLELVEGGAGCRLRQGNRAGGSHRAAGFGYDAKDLQLPKSEPQGAHCDTLLTSFIGRFYINNPLDWLI